MSYVVQDRDDFRFYDIRREYSIFIDQEPCLFDHQPQRWKIKMHHSLPYSPNLESQQ